MNQLIRSLLGLLCLASVSTVEASGVYFPLSAPAEYTDSLRGVQYFPRSVSTITNIDPELRALAQEVNRLYVGKQIDSLIICGNASPDGPDLFNRRLALQRAESVKKYFAFASSMPDTLMRVSSRACTWSDLKTVLNSRVWDNQNFADQALKIVAETSASPTATPVALKKADEGALWRWLDKEVFPLMRKTSVVAFYETEPYNLTPDAPPYVIEEKEVLEEVIEEIPAPAPVAEQEWVPYVYVKTNLPAWALLWTNVAVEFDITPHLSATLPIYYSGFNYFKRTLKFRTFAIQPELRYWLKPDNTGFFVGAHVGMVYYNVAFDGEYRYQDKNASTPALGGGFAVGYRFRLNSDPNLSMEATVGGGIYHLDYDIFYNHNNGMLTGHRTRTFYGLDQVALSIAYRFSLHKKSNTKGGEGR